MAREKENYEKGGKFIPDSELRKEFTRLRNSEEYVWLRKVSNNVTKQAIKDACNSYKNFFKGLQNYPKYKSKKKTTKKVVNLFQILNSEKNLQGLEILMNMSGCKMFPIM